MLFSMKELVIVICVLLVLLAVYIVVRTIIQSFKGKCCEGCKGCSVKDQCNVTKKNDE
ncbi:MAG: FeoB-associated Cys-rich membrane protein [Oscillospiraceae bacterium]